jgi:tetratricopeptide (TPR) repeat protein
MTIQVRMPVRLSAALLMFLALASPARAQDDVLAGYRKYYSGDRAGAQVVLERVLATTPGSLPARFGLLHIKMRRAQEDRALLPEFERSLEAFIKDAESRYNRTNQDSEALFYLANGLIQRAQYRVNYDKGMWGAARDGARAKRLIDTYIKRYPGHGDAYFTLGVYTYYVDIAPSFVRVLRLFLFLPGGNRVEGLKQVERAFNEGSLMSFPAGMLLMEMYATYEHRVDDAVRVGERLARDYPGNPDVEMQLAEIYASPGVEDYARAAQQYESVLKRFAGRPDDKPSVRYNARFGLASMRQQQWRLDEAIAAVEAGLAENPSEPVWVVPNLLLRRGNYRGLLDEANAGEDARRVRAEPKWKDFHKSADDQLAWLERRRQSGEARLYAALIPGNRLTAERRWDEAAAAYAKVRQQYPTDVQVRYRMAHLQFARGDAAGAAGEFSALANLKSAPTWLRSQSLLYLGRCHDLAGRRAEAIKVYERVREDYEKESAAYRAQVGLVTPYKRQGN